MDPIPPPRLAGPKSLAAPDIADALFGRTLQGILRVLYGKPYARVNLSEIIRRVGCGSGSVQRRLDVLARAGILWQDVENGERYFEPN